MAGAMFVIGVTWLLVYGEGADWEASNVTDEEYPDETNIIGGFYARAGQFPYVASVQEGVVDQYVHICGGVIIGVKSVVTGAHCFGPPPFQMAHYMVKAGITWQSDGGQKVRVHSIDIPVQYKGISSGYDIALVTTARPFVYNKFVAPIKVAVVPAPRRTWCVVAGWGANDSNETVYPDQMKALTVVALDNCSTYVNNTVETVNLTCAAGGPNEDTCVGDSGSPLVCNDTVYGIVSFGSDVCAQGVPTFFTSMHAHSDWLRSMQAVHELDGHVHYPPKDVGRHKPGNGATVVDVTSFTLLLLHLVVINTIT